MTEKPPVRIMPPAMLKALTQATERLFCPGFTGPLPRPRTPEENAEAAAAFDRALKDPDTEMWVDEY